MEPDAPMIDRLIRQNVTGREVARVQSTLYAVGILEQPPSGEAGTLTEIVLMFESISAARTYGAAHCPGRYIVAPIRFNLPHPEDAGWTEP
ncbi:hypothetical protein [Frankia sp. Cas4]|uniref:hypothetical protein n=1 Tax=Frankia sp. Cas4 TaxID=3073927 RepID=UPI002AD36554|nr:hypothetical protein [Frankia sp. Cas4]